MKLKLQAEDTALVLAVTEQVRPEDILVLQVGLKKLAEQGKKCLIVDLSAAQLSDPSLGIQIAALAQPAKELGLRFFIAGPSLPLSLGKTAADALAKLKEGVSKGLEALWTEEASLKAEDANLKERKAAAEKKLSSAGDSATQALQKENAALTIRIKKLEGALSEIFATARKEEVKGPALPQRLEQLQQVVDGVLKQAGY